MMKSWEEDGYNRLPEKTASCSILIKMESRDVGKQVRLYRGIQAHQLRATQIHTEENQMKRNIVKQGMGIMFGASLLALQAVNPAAAGVNVNVNIGPPPIVVAAPPEVVLMPNYGVYFVPEVDFDVFFYNGYWWSPRGDRWYRSQAYNGPWRIVERRYVPPRVVRVPRDYRRTYVHERRVPYGEWRSRHGGEHRGHEARPMPPGQQRHEERSLPPGQQRHEQHQEQRHEDRDYPRSWRRTWT